MAGQTPAPPRRPFPYRGAIATLLMAILLVTPPATVLDREGAFADTRADIFTSSATPVRLKDTLRTDLASIPAQVGDWTGHDDQSWPAVLGKYLQYDNLLVRDYLSPGLYQGVQLMVLTARHPAAFHNPEICFTAQDGVVRNLESTEVDVGGVAAATQVSVGRMLITYPDGLPARLVYNLYVVERHLLSQDRTTWIRIAMTGVDPDNLTDADARMHELEAHLAPTLFSTSGEARTTLQWVNANFGPVAAAAAVLATLAPVGAELLLQGRRPGGGKA